jgi:hypothetical protein
MDEATGICARLLREGTVPRAALPDLDFPEVRLEVERRLAAVGLALATSAYSEHVGIRLSPEVADDAAFDAASNLGLRADACALLVILWARLVLQKRTALDTRETPGQASIFAGEAAQRFEPQVRVAALAREFRTVLGGRSHILRLAGQLRRLGFVAGRGEVLEAGPLLELAIDGERMIGFIRREVLARLLAEREPPRGGEAEEEALDGRAAQALETLARLGGTAAIGALERETGLPRGRLRPLLRELIAAGHVRRTGERGSARYHLEPEGGDSEAGFPAAGAAADPDEA